MCVTVCSLQPEAPTSSSSSSIRGAPRAEEEEDEDDLNKALGVQRFQQILSPSSVVPDDQHRNYHEEDIRCKPCSESLINQTLLMYHLYFMHANDILQSS